MRVHLTTAKALRLTIPESFLLRGSEIADRFDRVKAGASRPRAARGYGLDSANSISATATVRSAERDDR